MVLNISYIATFSLKQGKSSYRVRNNELLYTVNSVFITESHIPSSLLVCCQHILVLLLHILWRGCYVAWYYYHQFLVLLLKLFVSWPHHSALRIMMKVTTVEWSVWIVGSVCLCIFLTCKEEIDTSQINITWMFLIFIFMNKNQFIMPFFHLHRS